MLDRVAAPMLAVTLLVSLGAGCDSEEAAPVFRNPVAIPDAELAPQVLRLIGAPVAGTQNQCQTCHGMTKGRLHAWAAATQTALTECVLDLTLATEESARATIDCFRNDPLDPTSGFNVTRFGMLSAAARLPWFRFAFDKAYDGDEREAELAKFDALVAMPHDVNAAPQLTQEEFDLVAEYFARGAPLADALITDDDPPDACTDVLGAALPAHAAALKTTGWRQVNADNHMNMFGCAAGETGLACLQTKPAASTTTFGDTWDVAGAGAIRVLKELPNYESSFWTRSSPDGRFVAHGGGTAGASTIIDLQRDALVGLDAFYDPAFFPDNTGFMFQGNGRNSCSMSVLTDLTGSGGFVNTDGNSRCSNLNGVGLYQHVGQVLGGGDYFAISGEFVSDNGGHQITTSNPDSFFGSNAVEGFTPIVFNGTTYDDRQTVYIQQPHEGDSVISPSMKLLVNRVAGGSGQNGYAIRSIAATPDGQGSYDISTTEVGRLCERGGKPAFSYDERWMVYHHYVEPQHDAEAIELGFTGIADPGFNEYNNQGAANVYLMDLTSGARYRITNMKPGQYALFPHFRSDGWIYIQVRSPLTGAEYTIASPAALVREAL